MVAAIRGFCSSCATPLPPPGKISLIPSRPFPVHLVFWPEDAMLTSPKNPTQTICSLRSCLSCRNKRTPAASPLTPACLPPILECAVWGRGPVPDTSPLFLPPPPSTSLTFSLCSSQSAALPLAPSLTLSDSVSKCFVSLPDLVDNKAAPPYGPVARQYHPGAHVHVHWILRFRPFSRRLLA